MAIKPILFNTDMVKAILDGRKTQTRRILKAGRSRYYMVGDIMWVRETWQYFRIDKPAGDVPAEFKPYKYLYFADGEIANSSGEPFRWRPSIHMPKEAARIFLRVKNVRQERLNQMQVFVGDIFDEGVDNVEEFKTIWDSTLKPVEREKYGWDANPWVWVIEFERCDRPEGWDDYVR